MNPSKNKIYTKGIQWVLAIPECWDRSSMRKFLSTIVGKVTNESVKYSWLPDFLNFCFKYVSTNFETFKQTDIENNITKHTNRIKDI